MENFLSEMSDDELDELIRKANDGAEFPFKASSFDKFKEKAALTAKSQSDFKKRWLILLACLLFLGSSTLYFLPYKKDKISFQSLNKGNGRRIKGENKLKKLLNNTKEISSTIKLKAEKSTVLARSEETNLLYTDNENKGFVKNSKNLEKKAKFGRKGNSTDENQKLDENIASNKLHKTQSTTIQENENRRVTESSKTLNYSITSNRKVNFALTIDRENKHSKKGLKTKQLAFSNIYEKNWSLLDKNSIANENVDVSASKINDLIDKSSLEKVDFSKEIDSLKNKGIKFIQTNLINKTFDIALDSSLKMSYLKKYFPRFAVRLALAPDISSIESLGSSPYLGGSIGLLVEYKISKKFTFQTGATYSTKSYSGIYDSFHGWNGEWQGIHPTEPSLVSGNCKMIEIPINLRFNFYQKPNYTWFVSSGILSNLMLNESYTYNFDGTSTLPKSEIVNDGSTYFFSTLNFSLGVERRLSKNLFLQVEPFLKIPLKNIGRGGMSLYSSGLILSGKYEF